MAATLGVFSLYYSAPIADHVGAIAVVAGLTAFTITISFFRARRFMAPIRAWVTDQSRREDPVLATAAWETAVGVPAAVAVREIKWPILFVAIPGVIGAVVMLDLSYWSVFPLFAGCLLAVGYGAVLHYFALEGGMRPVLKDINRRHRPVSRTGMRVLPVRSKLIAALPLINVITGLVAAALSGGGGGGASLGADVLIAIGTAFAASLLLTLMFLGSIMRPLRDLEEGIRLIRQGQFGATIPVTTLDEFGELSAAFNGMSQGLAERERIRATFATYMDGGVADHILRDESSGAGAEIEVSLLFCDVREFTAFAAKAQAPEVLQRLNHLFEAVVPIINGHGGHVNKFVGDGLLAVFGAPEPYEDHAERAVRCAIAMAQRVNHGGSGLFSVGIGVNSGNVVAGSIGGAGRLEYSVIGDAVNVAARVEAATRDLEDEVLITEQTRLAVGGTIELERRGMIEIRGKSEPVEVWAPIVQTAERRLPAAPEGAAS